MARKIRPKAAAAVSGIRALQVAKCRAYLDRLPVSTDVYDFGGERLQVLDRIAKLEAGEVVHLQTWQLADELKTIVRSDWARTELPKCWRIEGDELIPEDYERVTSVAGEGGSRLG